MSMTATERMRKWRRENPERNRALVHAYYQRHKDRINADTVAHRRRNRERTNANARAWRRRLREEVLAAYSHACACCGEARFEFLAIDHVSGDGAAHRKKVAQHALLGWLKREGYPAGFRVLCHNCNMSRGVYGHCPHEVENAE